jgi:hypothetical protein
MRCRSNGERGERRHSRHRPETFRDRQWFSESWSPSPDGRLWNMYLNVNGHGSGRWVKTSEEEGAASGGAMTECRQERTGEAVCSRLRLRVHADRFAALYTDSCPYGQENRLHISRQAGHQRRTFAICLPRSDTTRRDKRAAHRRWRRRQRP